MDAGCGDVKQCNKCLVLKSVALFSKRAKSHDGLQRTCKECAKTIKSAWDLENIGAIREYRKSHWRSMSTDDRDQRKIVKKEFYERHKPRLLQKMLQWQKDNKELVNKKNREWAKKNPLQGYVKSARRMAAKKNAIALWADKNAIRFVYQAAKDMTTMYGKPYEVDHIVPLQSELVCGLHCEANLQILPRSVNASKGNRYWPDMPT